MELSVDARAFPKIETEALVTYVFEGEKFTGGLLAELDATTGGALSKVAASGELTGKMLETTLLYYPQGLAAQRLLVLGAGKKDKFGTAELRRLAAASVRMLKSRQVKSVAFLARESERSAAAAEAITEGLILANFDSDKYKTEKKSTSEIASARSPVGTLPRAPMPIRALPAAASSPNRRTSRASWATSLPTA